jgi:hypothetical protein
LLAVGRSHAAVLDAAATNTGSLATAQATNAASANSVKFGTNATYRGVLFTLRNTAGTATVSIDQNCTGVATDWVPVQTGTAMTVNAAIIRLPDPFCEYRASTTGCTGCSVSVLYTIQPKR